jgi:hypothetical protein
VWLVKGLCVHVSLPLLLDDLKPSVAASDVVIAKRHVNDIAETGIGFFFDSVHLFQCCVGAIC